MAKNAAGSPGEIQDLHRQDQTEHEREQTQARSGADPSTGFEKNVRDATSPTQEPNERPMREPGEDAVRAKDEQARLQARQLEQGRERLGPAPGGTRFEGAMPREKPERENGKWSKDMSDAARKRVEDAHRSDHSEPDLDRDDRG